jgi:hypothetical protein
MHHAPSISACARHVSAVSLAILSLMSIRLTGQEPATLPVSATFEVASVKPVTDPTIQIGARSISGGRLSAVFTVRTLVSLAYGYPNTLIDSQIVGGPAWINTEQFEINATFDGPIAIAPNSPPVRLLAMERVLLADRFKLKVHQEERRLLISFLPDVQRIVRDRTGLTEAFDLDIEFARDATALVPDQPPFMTALKEQLGLELRRADGSVNVIVIDSVERPAAD